MRLNFSSENAMVKNVVNSIEKKIVEFMKINNKEILFLANKNHISLDHIYGYDYYGENNALRELRVVALKISDENLDVILSPHLEYYRYWDEKEITDFLEQGEQETSSLIIHQLFGGELLGYFTAINIAEFVEEYV